jgi:DNA-binding SARP family transcriptional activator
VQFDTPLIRQLRPIDHLWLWKTGCYDRLEQWKRDLTGTRAGSSLSDVAASAGPDSRALPWPRGVPTPSPVEGAVLVCLLGWFKVLKLGQPVSLRAGGRTQHLLSTLALGPRRHGITRDDLLERLWPDGEAELATQALRALVYALHRSLGDALEGQAPVISEDGRYRLNVEAGVVVDVDRFDGVIDAAEALKRAGNDAIAIDRYRTAVGLYEGDLAISSDIQHLVERERLRARYINARTHLAEHFLGVADYAAALANALDVLAVDPLREDAHRLAMRCYTRRGERAQALRQYRLCSQILASEFQAAPEPETLALYELVRLDPHRA